MTALSAITIKGFRSIGSVEDLAIRPINVLIGANGSGKSNFLGVFKLLQAIRAGRLQDYVARAGGADRLLHFGSKVTEELVIRLTFGTGYPQYEITLDAVQGDWLRSSESVRSWDQGEFLPSQITSAAVGPASETDSGNTDSPHSARRAIFGTVAENSQPRDLAAQWDMTVADIQDHLEHWRVYHFFDTGANSPLKKHNDLHDNRFLRPDGANLAAFLYLLCKKYTSEYDLIRRTVRLVAPFFEDFRLEPLALNPDMIRLEWRHKRSDAYFDASSLSDGTLRFIALATLLLQPEALRPSVILVDEPELGLHPYALELLASLVKQAAVKSRVILATESPILLDHFDPEDVLVTALEEDQTTFRRLNSADLEVWLEDYSLGQLWEKNELGGRPAGA